MDYKTIGRTGLKVSPLCFGTMSFGDIADLDAARAMFNRCREAGINFFDCANSYTAGAAEEMLGALIRDCRDELVITSKVGNPTGDGVNDRGHSRRHIIQACEDSLRRLGVDRVEFYFLHIYDPETPMDEILAALDQLVRQGKILYPAVSNWSAWQVVKALGIAAQAGLTPFYCLQPMYNLIKRQAEVELLPMAAEENLGVITYSPLAGGMLTGKYAKSQPKEGRFLVNKMYQKRYGDQVYQDVSRAFTEFAEERGFDPASLAVAWVMGNPAVTAPIIGARNVEQLESSLAAVDVPMTPELRQEISDLGPAPAVATDRTEVR